MCYGYLIHNNNYNLKKLFEIINKSTNSKTMFKVTMVKLIDKNIKIKDDRVFGNDRNMANYCN